MQNSIWVGLIITLVILILFYITYCNSYCNDYLHGMWEADKEFCEESGVTAIMVMVGPSQGGLLHDKRKMYVLMYDDDDVLVNQTVDVQIAPTWKPLGNYQNRLIHIEDPDFDKMPRDMTMSVSVLDGHMVFYGVGEDKETIYMSLYKDHDSTHKAKLIEKMSNGADDDEEVEETEEPEYDDEL